MSTFVETLMGRVIGSVESINARMIEILIDPSAPHATALNTGTPMGFPRINGYLLIPNESGATVCIITSIEIKQQPYSTHAQMKDANLINLPFQVRLAKLMPLATLTSTHSDQPENQVFKLQRGVDVFPSVGDPVLLPTDAQLYAMVGGENSDLNKQIWIGTCPTAGGAPVHVNPDKLFGRHLAILGNTGAGKSCTVAGLIRWSMEAAKVETAKVEAAKVEAGEAMFIDSEPNTRFIILDPNGEYAQAFDGFSKQIFKVEGGDGAKVLKVPAWLWNGEEWSAFTGASLGVQRPILFDAIRRLRSGADLPDLFDVKVRTRIEAYHKELLHKLHDEQHMHAGRREGVAGFLEDLARDLDALAAEAETTNAKTSLLTALQEAAETSREVESAARDNRKKAEEVNQFEPDSFKNWWHQFTYTSLDQIKLKLETVIQNIEPGTENFMIDENTPKFFPVRMLSDSVMRLAAHAPGRDVAQFVNSLKLRIESLFATGPLASITDPSDTPSLTLESWLEDYLGPNQNSNSSLSVLDLSLVPSEVVHIVVAVLARMLFEAVQRHRKHTGSELPTVLVLDEAHTFVHRELTSESASNSGKICCQAFERIAREGRKFGFGLVLASQRPSDISPTVLSQCNTFLLHRIVNDRDQDLVKRLVPDGLGDLLRELPSLPSKRFILLGWGAPTPLLTEVRDLPEKHRPHSPDPEFWNTWTGIKECKTDWPTVCKNWISPPKPTTETPKPQILNQPKE